MQLSRKTAESLGVTDITHPGQNIAAGVQHLKDLYDFYDKAEGKDRLQIALAAYNIGLGHILDARNLARQNNLDPDKWSALQATLPLLSQRRYHQKARYGYCSGSEPVDYVRQIMIYYDILRRRDIRYTDLDPSTDG